MANSLVARHQADPVDGDTTCPHEVAPYSDVPNLAYSQTTVANAFRDGSPALAEGSAIGDAYPILDALPFGQIWAVDFEFDAKPGENPEPVCLVAWELRSGRKVRLWRDEFGDAPPYPNGPDVLFVAYYASAEIGCHLALGWPAPERVLDLFTEFRNHTNGIPTISGAGLLGALAHYG